MKKSRIPSRARSRVRPSAPSALAHRAVPRAASASPRGAVVGRGARGFTLIEVMIALIVLVLGVLGAAAMTLNALRDNKQSGLRSQATALAYEMSDIMRTNAPIWSTATPPVLLVDTESVFTGAAPTSGTSTCWTGGCAPLDKARNDYYEWYQAGFASTTPAPILPNAAAKICRDAGNLTSDATGYATCDGLATSPLVVKLKWEEKSNNARGATSPAAVQTAYLVVPIQPY